MVQTPTELDTQCIYALDTSDDLPLALLPLVVDHKINHKYPKLLCKPILITSYDRAHVPRATGFSVLNVIEIESTKVSNISWTKTRTSQHDMRSNPTELPTIPPETSFQ